MTAQRPNVVVYQEYKTLTVTPDIPDLNVLIVGPAKQLLDYLDEKSECYAADYGTYQGNCPMVDPAAVIIATPPNIAAGGVLDSDTVNIYFDVSQVVLVENPDLTINPDFEGRYTSGDNLFWAHSNVAGQHFGTAEVAPGDTLIVENSGTDNFLMTVKEVCYTLVAPALNFMGANPVQPNDIVSISLDTAPVPRNGTYAVKRVVNATTLEVVAAPTWVGTFFGVATATLSITDAYGTPRFPTAVATGLEDYCNLRMTSDFTETAAALSARQWRVERKVSDILLDSANYTISGNSVTVAGAITVDLSSTLTGKKVSYAKIYMEYAAFRTDLQKLTTLSNYSEIEATLGKYDSRNPLMVGAVVAKANTTTPVKIYAVPDSTLPDYLEFLDRISTERDVYAIVPLTYNTSILNAIRYNCENLSDPNYVLTHGIKQKFRVVIGAVELQTTKYMFGATGVGGVTVSQQPVTAPTGNKKGTIVVTGGVVPDLFALGIIPGDYFEVGVYNAGPPITYTWTRYRVAQTYRDGMNIVFESDTEITSANLVAVNDMIRFTRNGALIAGSDRTVDGIVITAVGVTAGALDNLYLVLNCPTGTFLTSGVIPGDVLEMPSNPTVNNWSATPSQFVIDEVISNQKLRIVNRGNNTSSLEVELPHGGRRTTGTEITTTEYCRVLRNLDKTQQVNEMVAVAQSITSKRCILCFPDEVMVTSLVDGSAPRITDPEEPEAAGVQPGYYLSCAVGGQTAGQPPQQGFTNLGISGIDTIYHSGEYFSEEQITNLSNGGIYVFVQANPAALPSTIHEVTTDVSALEFSEYMVVKDFDFIAWTFLDTLLPFLGIWNVTAETIEFIRQALFTTGNNLKARKVAKIGPPLLDYQLDSVEQSDLSKDRIEAYMQVNLPMTLNTIGLHLVA